MFMMILFIWIKLLPTVDVIQSIFAAGKDIIFVSGRGDNCRRGTEKWLLDKSRIL